MTDVAAAALPAASNAASPPGPFADVGTERDFSRVAAAFVAERITPFVDAWERERSVPRHVLRALGDAGLLAACAPGTRDGFANRIALARALARAHSGGVMALVLNHLNLPLFLLHRCGSTEVHQSYVARSLAGTAFGAIAITEADGGSDVLQSTRTTVRRDGDCLVLDGEKWFVLNLPGADFVIVLARSEARTDFLGFSLVVVPIDAPGVSVERIPTGTMRTAHLGRLALRDCRVSADHALGRWHSGLLYLGPALVEERLVGSAAVLAYAEEVLSSTIAWAAAREFGEGTLAALQVVRHRISDFVADVAIAKAGLDDAARRCAAEDWSGSDATLHAAAVKLVASDTARRVIDGCLQLHGGRGYLETNWIARAYRDCLAATLYAGTSEIMKEIVAERLRL
jgi:alkylation response protein AidB-like acyl-CoA dehydrogenase